MRVLVCGGTEFDDARMIKTILDRYPITVLIHGAAPGADTLAANYALERGLSVLRFPADWARYKKMAGRIRNYTMLGKGKPERVVAFPGASGTEHMCIIACDHAIPVDRAIVIDHNQAVGIFAENEIVVTAEYHLIENWKSAA